MRAHKCRGEVYEPVCKENHLINYIVGKIVEKEQNKIILDKDGLAFDINFPTTSTYSINIGEELKIFIYMVFSQDDISMYGFLTKEDKEVFELLLKVNRLGPKGAMSIISTLGSEKIKSSIVKKDSKSFSAISGIGSKVADKIIIELYDKVKTMEIGDVSEDTSGNKYLQLQNEAIEALVALGYTKKTAESLVTKVELTDNMKADELIKLALKK